MISQDDIYRFTDYISQIIKIDGNPVVKPIEHVGFSIPTAINSETVTTKSGKWRAMEAMAVCEGSGARRTAFGHGLARQWPWWV